MLRVFHSNTPVSVGLSRCCSNECLPSSFFSADFIWLASHLMCLDSDVCLCLCLCVLDNMMLSCGLALAKQKEAHTHAHSFAHVPTHWSLTISRFAQPKNSRKICFFALFFFYIFAYVNVLIVIHIFSHLSKRRSPWFCTDEVSRRRKNENVCVWILQLFFCCSQCSI